MQRVLRYLVTALTVLTLSYPIYAKAECEVARSINSVMDAAAKEPNRIQLETFTGREAGALKAALEKMGVEVPDMDTVVVVNLIPDKASVVVFYREGCQVAFLNPVRTEVWQALRKEVKS